MPYLQVPVPGAEIRWAAGHVDYACRMLGRFMRAGKQKGYSVEFMMALSGLKRDDVEYLLTQKD